MNVLNCGLFESEGPGWPEKKKQKTECLLPYYRNPQVWSVLMLHTVELFLLV